RRRRRRRRPRCRRSGTRGSAAATTAPALTSSSSSSTLLAALLLTALVGAAAASWFCVQQHQTIGYLTDTFTGMQMKLVKLQSAHEEIRQANEESSSLAQRQVAIALATAEQLKTSDLPAQVLSLHTELRARLTETQQQAAEQLAHLQGALRGKSEEMEVVRLQVEGLGALAVQLAQRVDAVAGGLGDPESEAAQDEQAEAPPAALEEVEVVPTAEDVAEPDQEEAEGEAEEEVEEDGGAAPPEPEAAPPAAPEEEEEAGVEGEAEQASSEVAVEEEEEEVAAEEDSTAPPTEVVMEEEEVEEEEEEEEEAAIEEEEEEGGGGARGGKPPSCGERYAVYADEMVFHQPL
ncbi:hypothetical protein CRUP_037298, partial [Coryphaenoides rupestris]